MGRPRKNRPAEDIDSTEQPTKKVSESKELVDALVQAINLTRPVEKKTAANRKPNTPWTPKDGSVKPKMRRKMYQHGIPIDPDLVSSEQIELLNKIKTGRFMEGWVKVFKRKDSGIDIDYPVKTAAQRIKMVSHFGIRNLTELLQRCIDEKATQLANRDKYVDED